MISGIRIKGTNSSPSQVRVIGGLPTGGLSEEISVIEEVLTDIEITQDRNSCADSNNSFDDDWPNNYFEHDDHHRKHDNRQDAHDNDDENYQNESATNFSFVYNKSQGQSFIYDSINRPQDPCGFQCDQTVCREEESIYDSITRPYDPCNLHNLQTIYQEECDHEDDHEDDTLHIMCGSNMSSKGMSYKNDNSVQVDCCVLCQSTTSKDRSVRSNNVYSGLYSTSDSTAFNGILLF